LNLIVKARAALCGFGLLICAAAPLWAQDSGVTPPEGWPSDAQVLSAIGVNAPVADQGLSIDGYPCTISPRQTVNLAPPVAGVISHVAVRPGQTVAKGDIIATFDDEILRSDLALAEKRAQSVKGLEIAQSRLAGLMVRLDRLQAASKSRSVPAADLENAQLEVDIARGEVGREAEALALAKLDLERARVMVEKTIVRAPVAGRIGEDLIDPGESPSQSPIATIYVTTPMRIEAYVPTAQVAKFIEMPAFSAHIAGNTYKIQLDHRASVADLSSNTLSVFFNITSDEVLPGLDCKILNSPSGISK